MSRIANGEKTGEDSARGDMRGQAMHPLSSKQHISLPFARHRGDTATSPMSPRSRAAPGEPGMGLGETLHEGSERHVVWVSEEARLSAGRRTTRLPAAQSSLLGTALPAPGRSSAVLGVQSGRRMLQQIDTPVNCSSCSLQLQVILALPNVRSRQWTPRLIPAPACYRSG